MSGLINGAGSKSGLINTTELAYESGSYTPDCIQDSAGNNKGVYTKIGDFVNHHHGIAGTVYAKDEKTLVVKGFTYDGAGPDAFFWAGTQGSPSGVGEILPYPFEGKFYDYEDRSAPILSGSFNGDQEITLTLPENLKVTDLKWLSVWCRAFSVNFGDIIFPQNFALGDGGNLNDNPENNLDTSNANGPKKDE